MRNYDFYIDACLDAAAYWPVSIADPELDFAVGEKVRILAGPDRGRHAVVIGYNPDGIVAPWEVRPEDWPHELPGLMFEADELEVEE